MVVSLGKQLNQTDMNTKFVTPADWTKFKNQIIGNQPFKKQVQLTEIDIISESKIGLQGAEVPLTPQAANDLRGLIGLPVKFSKDIDKNFGEEARRNIIAMCKMMRTADNSPMVTLVIDPKARQIVRIVREDKMLSMDSFFDTFERLMNQHNLDIKEYHTCGDGGVNLSVVSSKSEFQVGNFADEIFHPGMTFKNNMRDGSYIMPFMYRLVCTNGMVNQSFGSADLSTKNQSGPIQLGGSDFKSMDLFYKHIQHFVDGGFYPDQFKTKIQLAMNTMASLAEVESAGKLIINNSNAKDTQIDNFIPVQDIRSQYKKLGVNPALLSTDKMRTSRTNVTIWDVVNGVTDFASHDYGFVVSAEDRLRMQVQAGDMLSRSFDTANLMNIHLDPKK